MLTDTHCHPCDLARVFPESEQERRKFGVLAAASACNVDEFAHNEILAHNAISENAVPVLLCYGIHPQQLTMSSEQLEILDKLAKEKRIGAIGECGFDLYNETFRAAEVFQDRFFAAQIEIARKYELPVVLHVRRAIHKIFACTKTLSMCKAVVFHSWPGTFEEAQSLLRRGVNAYFSFGNTIMLNHKQAMRTCALLPLDRILTETDAPYQWRRTEKFSRWSDLPLILKAAASLRCETANITDVKDLEAQIEENFLNVFSLG